MGGIVVRVSVPVVSFRPYLSRDYQDTYPVPPPATVFGMLLSLCGISHTGRSDYQGTELATLVDRVSEPSRVLRKLRRDTIKDRKRGTAGYRPDYQELIFGLQVWVAVRQGGALHDLSEHVLNALENPACLDRYGALSLGESTFLVDEITACESAPSNGTVLQPDDTGSLTLPVWVEYRNQSETRLQRFNLAKRELTEEDYVRVMPAD